MSNLIIPDLKLKGFKVYTIENSTNDVPVYNRRDLYKICLNTGENIIHYENHDIKTDGSILFFANPLIPYSWEILSRFHSGFACVFTEDFFKANGRKANLQESPLFKAGGSPVVPLTRKKKDCLETIFQKMHDEQNSEYAFKDEMIRDYIDLLIHDGTTSLLAESVE